ncbi:hypothetical protein KSZ_20330 [Dictyobacter formicarum]|uniref:Uncharacterized protein n=1 Tax=Dictyobacter formicarum TaxID=2778368 RepID=A0ABQ3VCZ3_9CHLR|nr:hypothetical protein KSZ_20330 [Dictyobacter formicarum]
MVPNKSGICVDYDICLVYLGLEILKTREPGERANRYLTAFMFNILISYQPNCRAFVSLPKLPSKSQYNTETFFDVP